MPPNVVRAAKRRRGLGHHGQVGLLVGALCLASIADAANDDPVVLTWSAPADGDCPDAAYALREIRRHLGPAKAERKSIRASVVIRTPRAGLYQMILNTEQGDSKGERTLSDASCGALADAAIVVLAWMIDPTAMENRSGDAPLPAPASMALTPVKPVAKASAPRGRALGFFAGLAPSGDVGTLPTLAIGGQARLGASVRPLRVAAYGAYWPSSSKTVAVLPDGRSVGGTFTLLTMGVQACVEGPFASGPPSPTIGLCAGAEIDAMRGRGFGVSAPADGTKSWAAATAGVQAGVALGGPWRLSVQTNAVFPVRREHFSLQGVGDVHQPAKAAARVAVGLEVAF